MGGYAAKNNFFALGLLERPYKQHLKESSPSANHRARVCLCFSERTDKPIWVSDRSIKPCTTDGPDGANRAMEDSLGEPLTDGKPQRTLSNRSVSGTNGTFAVPRNIKAQQLRATLLLLEVFSLQIKPEGRPLRDEDVNLVKEKVG